MLKDLENIVSQRNSILPDKIVGHPKIFLLIRLMKNI